MVAEGNQRLIVCLLPGLDGAGRLYRRFEADLSDDFDVRVFDYPTQEFGEYESLSAAILPRLPQEGPFVLIAESFAGPLAVMLAETRPPGLVGVVIAASFLRTPVTSAGLLAWILRCLPVSLRPPISMLEAVLMGGWKDIEVRRELEASLRLAKPEVLKARLIAALEVDVRAAFKRITVPVLYLHANRDRLLRSGVDTDFAQSGVWRTDIEAPHFVFQAVGPQAAEAIRNFLRDRGIWGR